MQRSLPYVKVLTTEDGRVWELVVEKDPLATSQYMRRVAKLLLPYVGCQVFTGAIEMKLESVILSPPSIYLTYKNSIDIVPLGLYHNIYVLKSQGSK
ncbi:MAG: hypothetical protein QF858_03235 [Candidatus Pacebacteria bacterium]|jgi:hypothetical protein|nr:hypothetical protein [bacterium]MDP6527862.1 hypothetical protein [Candidatus Paceibacterota bacterium]|tara:strand:- start:11423 stop:11713 length:291 start_codon:yes stop_codon:yes gene_type:complete